MDMKKLNEQEKYREVSGVGATKGATKLNLG